MPEPSSVSPLALLAHLQQWTTTLGAAQTREDVASSALHTAVTALGATAGSVLLLSQDTRHLTEVASQGRPGKTARWDGPPTPGTPTGDAVLQRQALYFGQTEESLSPSAQTGGPSSTAVLPLHLAEQDLGVLVLEFSGLHSFPADEQSFLAGLAAQTALALSRAQLLTTLAAQVHGRTGELEAEREALEAFVSFSRATTQITDVYVLAQKAIETLRAVLQDVSVGYYERAGEVWQARVWSNTMPPEVIEAIRAGVPVSAPNFSAVTASGAPLFAPAFDATGEGVPEAQSFDAAAFFPCVVEEKVRGILVMGAQAKLDWSARDRQVFEAVGSSLTLALERTRAARQLREQKDEAERRSQALAAFAELSRDMAGETDRYALVRRAQEIILSLLTPGYALYWEAGADRWELKSQVGDIGNPDLQRLVDEQGLPLDAPALHHTWLTGEPKYQDEYTQGADTPAEMIRHVHAATAFQVRMHGNAIGMLAIGLFEQRSWTTMDRAMLGTAVYSLGLLLERAQSVESLERSNRELQASNEELEAFTYSASHDLRTPVRHIMSFAELAERALRDTPNEKAQRHLQVVRQGALRMNALIDGMLTLSRSGRQALRTGTVDLNELVTQARQDVGAEFSGHPVRWRIGELPQVRGDRSMLQQVMTNLLSNAVKYSGKREQSEVEVWCEEGATEWKIHVRDNGVGFDPQYTQRIFGIFQRLHTDRDFQGSGVGLATVRRIVLKHGGQVSAESHGDAGATFSFTLPSER